MKSTTRVDWHQVFPGQSVYPKLWDIFENYGDVIWIWPDHSASKVARLRFRPCNHYATWSLQGVA